MTYSAVTPDIVRILQQGGVVVMPTDTIYGLVGSATQQPTVERIYTIKNRPTDKPCIVLIADQRSLQGFGVTLTAAIQSVINRSWPGPTSLALPVDANQFAYLHRGTNQIAFRLPKHDEIIHILEQTGPLIATSANPTGQPPATSIPEAQNYFHNQVDAYVDGGSIIASPSQLLIVDHNGTTTLARP